MYKKIFVVILLVLFLVSSVFSFVSNYAWALTDPFSFYTLGGIAYAMATDWGISFTSANATAQGVSNWMSGQLSDYIESSGSSLTEIFGTEPARIFAGKLAAGQRLVNGMMGFIDWLVDLFPNDTELTSSFEDNVLPFEGESKQTLTGVGIEVIYSGSGVLDTASEVRGYYNGVSKFRRNKYLGGIEKNYSVVLKGKNIYVRIYQVDNNGAVVLTEDYVVVSNANLTNVLNWETDQYFRPTVLNPDQEWTGLIGGQDWPDTNLDDLIDAIYQAIGLNDLEVDGEIVDPVIPPTPVPTVAPDTSLQDVPWEGLNDLIGSTGLDITDSIGEAAQDVTGAVEGVQEGIQGLTDTISEALTAPEINEKKFDLRELFPFCIPFDIYHLLQKFDGSPAAPHVQLPIVIPSIGFSYILDLDFSAWDPVASAMRTVELIVYALGLAWATSKVIKW